MALEVDGNPLIRAAICAAGGTRDCEGPRIIAGSACRSCIIAGPSNGLRPPTLTRHPAQMPSARNSLQGRAAFPDLVEILAQLRARPPASSVGFAFDAVAERAEVIAAAVVGDERRGIGAVDRIVQRRGTAITLGRRCASAISAMARCGGRRRPARGCARVPRPRSARSARAPRAPRACRAGPGRARGCRSRQAAARVDVDDRRDGRGDARPRDPRPRARPRASARRIA